MKKWSSIIAVFAMGLLGSLSAAKADTVTSIGTQHFTDGTKITTSAFNTAVAGQPAPFNAFCGSDISLNCSASWTFTYSLPGGDTITAATLTLGIFDIDSAATGNQVGSFTLNGADDLTSQLNVVSEAASSANSFYNVLTLTIPSTFFADLQGGSATFALTLTGPGLGILGSTLDNGAGLDFSTLDIASEPSTTSPTPELSTGLLLCTGLLGLALARTLLRHS